MQEIADPSPTESKKSTPIEERLLLLLAVLSMAFAGLRLALRESVDLTVLAFLAFAFVVLVSGRLREFVAGKEGIIIKMDAKLDAQEKLLKAVAAGEVGGKLPVDEAPPVVGHVASTPLNPEDPEKGRWGGKAEMAGRRLIGEVTRIKGSDEFFDVTLRVVSTDVARPLTGVVRFHLHPSFKRSVVDVPVENGEARLELQAWGAFTVGAVCDGTTTLELDLAEDPKNPEKFRSR